MTAPASQASHPSRAERRRARCIAVVGHSGVGKTTLLTGLIATLESRGRRVGAVKHASHGFLADRPGKDSHRLYQAGSRAVALVSGEQLATFVRRQTESSEAALDAALASLPDEVELTLVEGFHWEPLPRIVLVASGADPSPELLEAGPVLAVLRVPRPKPGEPPRFSRLLLRTLAEEIEQRVPRPEPVPGEDEAHRALELRSTLPLPSSRARAERPWPEPEVDDARSPLRRFA